MKTSRLLQISNLGATMRLIAVFAFALSCLFSICDSTLIIAGIGGLLSTVIVGLLLERRAGLLIHSILDDPISQESSRDSPRLQGGLTFQH